MYDWNDLRIFLAIARSGSALAAAKELNLNQTTVTRRIDALEHALGCCLFLRGARGSHLTEHGEALLPHAEAVERAGLVLDGEAGRLQRDLSGEIRITAPEVVMSLFVGPLTLGYRKLHPEIRFDYLSAENRLDLAKGEADVAFRAGDGLEGDTLIRQALPNFAWTAFCAAAYAARHGLPAGIEDLAGHPTIGIAGPMTHMAHVKYYMGLVRACDLVGTSNNVPNMTGMIRAGLGIGILPCCVGDTDPDLVRCFAPPALLRTPQWWTVVSPEAWALPRVRGFVGYAVEALRRLRPVLAGEVDQANARAMIAKICNSD